ncbi:MAG: beta-galactosidase trimerization domain-containing protein, partial [Gemmataceae bacterium]|nr:beta-galactosidase trimerization domain-containing protein [Gemmataceae bacterium]
AIWWCITGFGSAQEFDHSKAAQAYRAAKEPVIASSATTVFCEAEEFQVTTPGWQAKPFGTNYYAATFANCFLSRKAYLGAPEQCETTEATLTAQVPAAGKYLVLVRYEAAYRFETQFRVVVQQGGVTKLDRLYGARDNLRIWAFGQKLKKEVAWDWGAGENLVWEGHDAFVQLDAGLVTLKLLAGKQPEPAAKRNVDLVMLTSDAAQVQMRIDKENYLPLDGMLTQAGDVYVKLTNRGESDLKVLFPNGTEHSPYWVHLRYWKPVTLTAKPGESTDYVDVGHLLDTLSDGQWIITAQGTAPRYDLDFQLRQANGKLAPLRRFTDLRGSVVLAYDGDTRYSRRIRLADEALYELVDYLRQRPVHGVPPKRTLIYGYTFAAKPGDAKYTAALNEFLRLIGATALGRDSTDDIGGNGLIRGYIDVRDVPTNKLEEYCKNLGERAAKIAVVSLGDEIGLGGPPAKDHQGFRAWLQSRKLQPDDVDPGAANWEQIMYSPTEAAAKAKPRLYYWSKIYAYRVGIGQLKERTDILRKYLPNAGIGANFSPHHQHMYLGDTHHWISLFREDGMTMPWGEDYIWQVPVASSQINGIMVDMFRAAVRHRPEAKIHYYVMPHAPNNTPKMWRRLFYSTLGHGARVINLFEFRPVVAAYTENHVNSPAMYQEVRRGIHELGTFEDIVQEGQVRPAQTALWFSEAADVWNDHQAPFDAAKRALYLAIRQTQTPLDFVVEGDDLASYKVLFLCDAHVSQAGSKQIAAWVAAGGRLIATAGAGMFDEANQPNTTLRKLLGVDQKELQRAAETIRFERQDLPFAQPLAYVHWKLDGQIAKTPVFGVRSLAVVSSPAKVLSVFDDGVPAHTEAAVGKGTATYLAFLPGLTYLKPAYPKRPMDRGATDDSMTHWLPTEFDPAARAFFASCVPAERPVTCSMPLVESTVLEAKQGVVIPLINWTHQPIKGLKVAIHIPTGRNVALASGGPVQMTTDGAAVCTLDLDAADALIFRK